MTVDFSNPDAVEPALLQGITDALTRVLNAPALFPVQRSLIPVATFFDSAEVSIAFVYDSEIQDLNKTWRNKNSATDVLSWPAVNTDEPLEPFLGDIAISLDTAGRQAATRTWGIEDEVSLLAVHGFLHLLGHDDDEDDDAARMRLLERFAVGKPLTLMGDDNAEA